LLALNGGIPAEGKQLQVSDAITAKNKQETHSQLSWDDEQQ
jgi:hypothetical protein